MVENRHASNLLYVDAGDIDDERVDFDGLDVLDPAGRKLGDVEGFVVQRETKRPYYVVVDSGGWFSSRSFLVPIGHARLDAGNDALRIDLDKDTVQRFPEFHDERLPGMSEEEIRQFNERTIGACCAKELHARTGPDRYDYDKWSHYAQPDWWQSAWFSSSGSLGAESRPTRGDVGYDVPPPTPARPIGERVIARDRGDRAPGDRDIDVVPERDDRDVRTPPQERAQPGDVLGIEHAGKTTELGDTAHDERERLVDQREDAGDLRKDDRKDRR